MLERVNIAADCGSLAGLVFHPARPARGAIIVCHGFRGAKENSGYLQPFARRLNQLSLMVVAFDFTGCGQSEGQFADLTLQRQARDLVSVAGYTRQSFGLPISLLGRSMGGSTIIAAAPQLDDIEAYVLWSTPFRLQETLRGMLGDDYHQLHAGKAVTLQDEGGFYQLNPGLVQGMSQDLLITGLQVMRHRPVLVVHGLEDETVSCDQAEDIGQQLPQAQVVLVPEANHRFEGRIQERDDVTIAWLQKVLTEGS